MKVSFKKFVTEHFKGNSPLIRSTYLLAKGIIGAAKQHHSPIAYLQEQIAEYNNKIITECCFFGFCWSAVGCDSRRTNDFYKMADCVVGEFVEGGDGKLFDEMHRDAELFLKYFIIIMYLSEYVERNNCVDVQIKDIKHLMLPNSEKSDKIERIKNNLDRLFTVKVKRRFPDLIQGIVEFTTDAMCNGRRFFALADVLYNSEHRLLGNTAPNTMAMWARKLHAACECDFPIGNYKHSKVAEEIKLVKSVFWYL